MEHVLPSYKFVDDTEELREVSPRKEGLVLCECTPSLKNMPDIKSDEQRFCFLKSLRGQSKKAIEDACPTLISLSTQNYDAPFKTAFEEFLLEFLSSSDSRLVRKTCLHLLRSIFYPLSEFESFFSLFSTLEESQYHVIEPILPKLNNLVELVKEKHLAWDYLKAVLKKMISHTNGWIRCFGFQSLTNVPVDVFRSDINFVVFDYYKSLNSYDPFWRLDETVGVVSYIGKLRNINKQCLSESFVKSLLSLFESRFSPSPLLFLSQTLPDVNDKYLTDDDMPLIRRVISEICCLQYPNLKNEVVFNFIKFLFAAFDWEGPSSGKGIISLFTFFPLPLRVNVCGLVVKYVNPRDLIALFDGKILHNGLLELLSCLPTSDFNEFMFSCDDINVKLMMAFRRHDFLEEDVVKQLFIERLFVAVEKVVNEEEYINLCLGPILSRLDVTTDIHEMLISNLEDNRSNISRRGLLLLLSHCKNSSLPRLCGLSSVEELAFFHLISLSTHLYNDDFNNEIKKNIDVFSTETEKAILFLEDCSRILKKVDSETKSLLLERCEVLAKETQKSSNFPIVCKYWIIIALSALQEVEKTSMNSLEKIMEIGLKNPQVAFMLSREVRSSRLPDCMANMMMRLAIYGDVVKKDDLVFHLANATAKRSDDLIYQ
uniref:HEAT repeat protein n=1 Tax=Bursaphelenchus xylophilus TaxID=6326 RepID=A0A1I7SH77_BURXY